MVRPFTTRNDHKFDIKSKTVVGGRSRLTESALDMLAGVKAPYGWQQVFVEKLRAVFNVATRFTMVDITVKPSFVHA